MFSPQAPGGDIRRLGFPRNELGRAFALAALRAVGGNFQGLTLLSPTNGGIAAARPTGRRALLARKPKRADARAGD